MKQFFAKAKTTERSITEMYVLDMTFRLAPFCETTVRDKKKMYIANL